VRKVFKYFEFNRGWLSSFLSMFYAFHSRFYTIVHVMLIYNPSFTSFPNAFIKNLKTENAVG
jgi:hypothetical protein